MNLVIDGVDRHGKLSPPPLHCSAAGRPREPHRAGDGAARQLFISWQAPPLDYLDDSIQYEVGILAGRTDCTVANVKEQTEYSIAVRAKPDGVSFGGYWSAWSQPVSLLTSPRDLDPLILALILILALLLLLIGTVLLLHHRRFLKQKIWPVIPNPANHFEGLFDMHKGNFQRWLGHSNTYLWWSPRLYAAEDVAASVEILSELGQAQLRLPVREDAARRVPSLQSGADERGSGPPVQARPPPLLKDSYVALDESFPSRGAAGDGGAYGTEAASENRAPRQTPEGSTVGRQREGDDSEPGSSPSTGMPSPSPGQSSSSSFEYTVFDPTADTLSPRARAPCSHPKYAYLLVSDSGVATDYSTTSPDPSKPQRGHYSNFYENTPTYAIYSQC
ncbi:erythropoietin receptor-like [Rhinatrema bivittatum]|uniref:erythropoietin receptor-like n=1 Tax=Rhinatrema bivittatum TaxID=194408 RepID=UPI00112A7820|nr:erythropoietin receptor-like [Rhinatrema bivittatum]